MNATASLIDYKHGERIKLAAACPSEKSLSWTFETGCTIINMLFQDVAELFICCVIYYSICNWPRNLLFCLALWAELELDAASCIFSCLGGNTISHICNSSWLLCIYHLLSLLHGMVNAHQAPWQRACFLSLIGDCWRWLQSYTSRFFLNHVEGVQNFLSELCTWTPFWKVDVAVSWQTALQNASSLDIVSERTGCLPYFARL